ncbi:MAG TPA: glycosyltransferase family 9 protein [Kiritimatiellia bacterium]|nr:glycosyltransferase family 9 protein [Kiritimatiellia bacterium]HMP35683.1 glycosyltransferase family 9 protein [Kiritimatiellia bacterium]
MRILVVKLSSLGDLFHALPAVAQVKAATGAEVDWVVNTGYAPLVSRFAPVRRVIGFPRQAFLARAPAFLRDLRAERYDLVLDLQGLMKSALVARAARGDKVIGPSFHREGSRWLYDAVTGPRNKERHAIDENFDLLDHLGIARGPVIFPVRFDPPAALPPGPRVALLPRSRWETKNWPPAHFAAVARELLPNASVYLFGAPEDRATCAGIATAAPGVTDLCAQTSLLELGGWLGAMDLVITVDSGPMHIAAAAGTRVLAVFGATEHRRTGPYGDRHRVLTRDDLACRPCLSRTCRLPERDRRCLTGLAPGRVIAEARELLALSTADR